jgi:YtkA-like
MILSKKTTGIGIASIGFLALISAGITGCGTSNSAGNQSTNMSMNMNSTGSQPMAKVKMTIPKETKVGEKNQFSVLVTQQDKPINQVDDVMFEIWQDVPNSKHEIIHATRTGDGIYSIDYSFRKAGTYDVMYHVVADGNMIMTGPQKIPVTK